MKQNDKFTTKFKNDLMKKLLDNKKIVEYINKDYLESPEELMYENIFPYIKLKQATEEDEEVYIGIAVSTPSVAEISDVFRDVDITFFILSHIGRLKTSDGGAVTDLIGDEILATFNHLKDLSFEFKLYSNDEGAYNEKYYFRQIIFTCTIQNNTMNGIKINRYGR